MSIHENIKQGVYRIGKRPTAPKNNCPECGSHHMIVTKFCPTCGSAFLDSIEKAKEKWKIEMKKYNQHEYDRHMKFKADALEHCNLSEHPKADKCFEMAWDRGHSSGLHSVVDELEYLEELVSGE